MDERIRYNPEQKKVTPIRPKSNLFHVYQLALQQFVIRKLLPKDAVSAFENPDPKRWVQVPSLDGICYLEVKNAAFPNEDDGPHAIFWFQKKLLVPEETKEHVLFNVDINLTAKTQRLFDFAMINEQGEFIKGISWTELTHKLQPISPRSEMRLMYQIILGRYAAEKVIPSEGALVFRKPDPERWLLVYDGDEIDEVSIYINTVNTVFYKDHDGVHAVFWYQVIPPAHERFRLRTLARFRMNLTKKTYYVSDTVEFDDEGQVEGSYTHEPEEIEVESVSPGTVMEDIYNYLLERSKSAEMVEMKAQEQKKETGAKKTKKVKRKKTYGKTKRSRKK